MVKSLSDSHLLPTQIGKSPMFDIQENKPSKKEETERLKVAVPIITAFIAVAGSLFGIAMQMKSATNKQVEALVQQINSKVIDTLEEQVQDLLDKNEDLDDELASLKENYQDLRRIMASKFGNNILVPMQRLTPRIDMRKPKKKISKIVLPGR
jgi:uncharacterized protein HemX